MPSLAERIGQHPQELAELVRYFVGVIVGKDIGQAAERVLEIIDKRLGHDYHWPGNVRELTQCIRRVLVKEDYEGDLMSSGHALDGLCKKMQSGSATADQVLSDYLKHLYALHGSYETVARIAALDRRTVKKKITETA